MATIAYTTGFSALVLKDNHPSKVVNIIWHVPEDAAFIMSKYSAD